LYRRGKPDRVVSTIVPKKSFRYHCTIAAAADSMPLFTRTGGAAAAVLLRRGEARFLMKGKVILAQ